MKWVKVSLLFISLVLVFHLPGCLEEKEKGEGEGGMGEATLIIEFGTAEPDVNLPEHLSQQNGAVRWVFENMSISSNETVFTFLIKASERWNFTVEYHFGTYGVFIDSIAGVSGGENSWWVYLVNGVFGDVAADKKVVEDGQEITWKYSTGA